MGPPERVASSRTFTHESHRGRMGSLELRPRGRIDTVDPNDVFQDIPTDFRLRLLRY